MAFSEEFIRSLPGIDPAFHLGEKPAPAPPPDPECSEAEFMAKVVKYARERSWLVFHCHDSRKSQPGWPDLALCRPPRLILAELKSADGGLTPAQKKWLNLLRKCNGVEAMFWRPSDWQKITELLL